MVDPALNSEVPALHLEASSFLVKKNWKTWPKLEVDHGETKMKTLKMKEHHNVTKTTTTLTTVVVEEHNAGQTDHFFLVKVAEPHLEMKLAVRNRLALTFVCELKKEEVGVEVVDCILKGEEVCKGADGIELVGRKGSRWNWFCTCWLRRKMSWRHSCCVGWKAGNS